MNSALRRFSRLLAVLAPAVAFGALLCLAWSVNPARAERESAVLDVSGDASAAAEEESPLLQPGALLTIIYCAESVGQYKPCPFCGGSQIGGLARRATLLDQIRALDPQREKTILLAGADEFLGPEGSAWEDTDPALAPAFLRAYEIMGYDRVFVTLREMEWLQHNSGRQTLPGFIRPLEEEPVVEYSTIDGRTVAVMALPELPAEMQEPSPGMRDAVLEAGREIRPHVDLLVAVSPWGKWGEEHFLRTDEEQPFDVFLGGGPGSGSRGELLDNDTLLWTRTFLKGRSLNLIHILAWPERGQGTTWVQGMNYVSDVKPLYDEVPESPPVRALFP